MTSNIAVYNSTIEVKKVQFFNELQYLISFELLINTLTYLFTTLNISFVGIMLQI